MTVVVIMIVHVVIAARRHILSGMALGSNAVRVPMLPIAVALAVLLSLALFKILLLLLGTTLLPTGTMICSNLIIMAETTWILDAETT